MKIKKIYHVAVYLRLSHDDIFTGGKTGANGKKTESDSISSQKELIRSYIRKQNDMEIYDIYADDGFSGVNFERPQFKRMMQDIKAGCVDCVIVKDLSRLGRDYIETGRLIQKTFPDLSVRFIALTDHFDSLTADHNEKSMIVPVKNFINDSYARDISGKVKSHQKMKRERGDFIGAFPVFGYKKSSKNRNLLVPDEFAADIVRKIFWWKMEGYSNLAIANLLDKLGILSPMEYKKLQGEKFQTGFETGIKTKWSAVAIKRILTNENYIGTLVQGKEEKVSYKVKKSVRKPEEEWTKVEGAHQAIVSKEDFMTVQELLKIDIRAGKGEKKAHIYAGLLFCGDCMEPMIRRVNKYKGKETVSFICATKNAGGKCTRHTISEKNLNRLLFAGLRQQVSLFLDRDRAIRSMEQMEIAYEEMAAFEKEIQRLYREQDKYLVLREGLYEDLKRQLITEEDYKNFRGVYEKRFQELQRAIDRQEETLKALFGAGVRAGVDLERMKRGMQITELDRAVLVSFVNRILVYEDKRIYLELKYKELFTRIILLAGDGERNQPYSCEEAL